MAGDKSISPLTVAKLLVAPLVRAAAKEFFDNRFLKELEDSGFVQEFYGKR
jgi:hypothetical protein